MPEETMPEEIAIKILVLGDPPDDPELDELDALIGRLIFEAHATVSEMIIVGDENLQAIHDAYMQKHLFDPLPDSDDEVDQMVLDDVKRLLLRQMGWREDDLGSTHMIHTWKAYYIGCSPEELEVYPNSDSIVQGIIDMLRLSLDCIDTMG